MTWRLGILALDWDGYSPKEKKRKKENPGHPNVSALKIRVDFNVDMPFDANPILSGVAIVCAHLSSSGVGVVWEKKKDLAIVTTTMQTALFHPPIALPHQLSSQNAVPFKALATAEALDAADDSHPLRRCRHGTPKTTPPR